MESPDQVLALRDVDGRLSADRRVDLGDERRRDGSPPHAAEIGGSDEAHEVERRAATERDERAVALESQLRREPLDDRKRLRRLTGRDVVGRDKPVPERRPNLSAVQARDRFVGDESQRTLAWNQIRELA